jgi:hypothetical protein
MLVCAGNAITVAALFHGVVFARWHIATDAAAVDQD